MMVSILFTDAVISLVTPLFSDEAFSLVEDVSLAPQPAHSARMHPADTAIFVKFILSVPFRL